MLSKILGMARGMGDEISQRFDGWINQMTGFGTSRDKSIGAVFQMGCLLTDVDLSNLWGYDDLAGRIVDVWPREEMRLGFGIKGLSSECATDVDRYLKPFDLVGTITEARIWGRLYGGCAIWALVDDGRDPSEPLDLERIRTVLGLRVVDRRWLIADQWYGADDGAKVGLASVYRMQEPQPGGVGATIGYIHESRLIIFPGARTERQEKIRLRGWDQSVLLKPYAALRAASNTWAAIDALVSDANQAVMSVEGLYEMIAGDPASNEPTADNPSGGSLLLQRAALMDQMRSAGRMIVLDKDKETFERKMTSFAGLPELSAAQWTRVSAASEIPVAVLTGQSPAGLNATGDTTFERFFAVTDSNRQQIDEPRILCLLRILLSADDAPELETETANDDDTNETQGGSEEADPLDAIGLTWLPLWAPNAIQLATIRLQRAQEANVWITAQGLLPEEAMLSLPKDWWTFDRGLREDELKDAAAELLAQKNAAKLAAGDAAIAGSNAAKNTAENPPEPNEPNDPNAQQGAGHRKDAAPKFAIGDRVEALVNHMPGMKGMKGKIAIAREGTPPYYGVSFDMPMPDMKDGVHKWLAENELEATGPAKSGM